MTSRRTFLRVLGSAAIGALVVPALPIPDAIAEAAPVAWPSIEASAGPLTYEMLERAYLACAIGREAPTLMIVPASVARRFGLVYDVEVEPFTLAATDTWRAA